MHVLIKDLDMNVWRSVLKGWYPPTKIDDDRKTVVKTKSEWIGVEDKSGTNIWMALNSIQYGVDSKKFSLIASSKSVEEAWDTL